MNAHYPARYSDANGEEKTIIRNDGGVLRMRVRGVEFSGTQFADLEPVSGTEASLLTSFWLSQCLNGYDSSYYSELCSCRIECDMPLPMLVNGGATEAILHVRVDLGVPGQRGRRDKEELHLTLHYAGEEYRGRGYIGGFDDELWDIQQALPAGVIMLVCFNCALSEYPVTGCSSFGSLACFRDNKPAILSARDKDDLIRIWYTLTEYVQETHLCPEFQQRVTGT